MIKKSSTGFTILEVLIATSIFTVVLLLCTQAVLRIGQLYYKGVASTQIQELSRQLSTELAEEIQFGSRPPFPNSINGGSPASPVIFCAGDYRYRITMNRELGTAAPSVLLRKPLGGATTCNTLDTDWGGATELGVRRMRILRFSINRDTDPSRANLWYVHIRLGLGDNFLYQTPSGGAISDAPANYNTAICRGGSGSQFCATSEFQSTLLRRVNIE